MATAFNGYLFGAVVEQGTAGSVRVRIAENGSIVTYYIIPFSSEYIALSTWKSTPNQREELGAYRDDNTRDLTRLTAPGMKSIFSFETRPNLHLVDKIAIQTFFTARETTDQEKLERKIELIFWNDEDNVYARGYFYRPNMQFPIKRIVQGAEPDIIYDTMKFSFVEY